MGSRRNLLIATIYIAIFIISLFGSPSERSILNTTINCLDDSDSDLRRCAYCWEKPTNLHPEQTIEISFPVNQSRLLLSRSCSQFTCLQSLQMFGQGKNLDNIEQIQQLLNTTQSQIISSVKQNIRIPQQTRSWKILTATPQNSLLPDQQSFNYLTNDTISFYRITQGLLLAVTVTILISTSFFFNTQSQQNNLNKLLLVFGLFTIILMYIGLNYTNTKVYEKIITGIAKGFFIYYVFNIIPSLNTALNILSFISMFVIIFISLYESFLSQSTVITGILILLISCILLQKIIVKDANRVILIFAFISLLSYSIADLGLVIDGSSAFWRLFKMGSMGLSISLLHTLSLNIVEFQVSNSGRPYQPSEQHESIVQIQDSSII